MKVLVRYPDAFEERAILDSMAVTEPRTAVSPVVSLDAIDERAPGGRLRSTSTTRSATTSCGSSRRPVNRVASRSRSRGSSAPARLRAARSDSPWLRARPAFLQGRGYVVPQDVKAVAPDVLRHRLTLSFEAEASGVDGDEIVKRVLQTVASP